MFGGQPGELVAGARGQFARLLGEDVQPDIAQRRTFQFGLGRGRKVGEGQRPAGGVPLGPGRQFPLQHPVAPIVLARREDFGIQRGVALDQKGVHRPLAQVQRHQHQSLDANAPVLGDQGGLVQLAGVFERHRGRGLGRGLVIHHQRPAIQRHQVVRRGQQPAVVARAVRHHGLEQIGEGTGATVPQEQATGVRLEFDAPLHRSGRRSGECAQQLGGANLTSGGERTVFAPALPDQDADFAGAESRQPFDLAGQRQRTTASRWPG